MLCDLLFLKVEVFLDDSGGKLVILRSSKPILKKEYNIVQDCDQSRY